MRGSVQQLPRANGYHRFTPFPMKFPRIHLGSGAAPCCAVSRCLHKQLPCKNPVALIAPAFKKVPLPTARILGNWK